jgi:hypothetical protein
VKRQDRLVLTPVTRAIGIGDIGADTVVERVETAPGHRALERVQDSAETGRLVTPIRHVQEGVAPFAAEPSRCTVPLFSPRKERSSSAASHSPP